MAKTFNPNRVRPGTIELVRDASGNYTTKVVGLETINSLSLPDISTVKIDRPTIGPITKFPIDGGGVDELKKQTQMAFQTGDDNQPDTTGDMLQEATKLSRNLSDFNPDTASEQFARQTILPGTFDAEKFDETEDKVSIKDPTERVFGKSTVEDAQKQRQTTLPDLSVDVEKKEPPGLFGFKFDRPIRKEDFLGDRFKQGTRFNNPVGGVDQIAREVEDLEATKPNQTITVDELQGSLKDLYKNKMNLPGDTKLNIVPDDINFRTLGVSAEPSKTRAAKEADFASGMLGIKADPTISATRAAKEAGFASGSFPGRTVAGADLEADAGTKVRADIKPKESALKTFTNSINTSLKNVKTPLMAVLDAVGRPVGDSPGAVAHAKTYFTDRGDGRIGGNPATDLYAGFNRVSKFGNLEKAGAKRLETRQKTIDRKGYKPGDKFYDDTQKMKEQEKDYKASKKAAPVKGTTKPGESGGSGPTGGGKIVCTMMNQRYGFGSFRNKIWLKFHKDYSAEYQKGYHKVFLPLVNIAKKEGVLNTIVRKILEHMGRHVTADMFQIMRNKKSDKLGRIYRKIFEPICYWLGGK
jgi:hypothetical protein